MQVFLFYQQSPLMIVSTIVPSLSQISVLPKEFYSVDGKDVIVWNCFRLFLLSFFLQC